jgi:hypothetical protein
MIHPVTTANRTEPTGSTTKLPRQGQLRLRAREVLSQTGQNVVR